jgi:hypothetical protein
VDARLNPIGHPPVTPLKEIGRYNLKMVLGRMGEVVVPIAIAQRPDVR